MKNLLYSISCFILAVSCSGFLDENNPTQYSVDYIYGSDEGLHLAVNALYAKERYYANDENNTIVALRRATDLAITNGGTGNYFGTYDPNYLKPSSTIVENMWKTMYSIIGKCNDIISAGENLEDTETLRTAIAEAKCFRAQSYFLLYRTYDRIWLNTEPTTPENINDKKAYRPATQNEVFDLIYSDLRYAIKNLGWQSYETGRFNQAAARHMLAKAALWVKDWQTAIDQVDTIEQSGFYHLVDLDKVFNAADLNHEESLLTQQWSSNLGGNLSNATPKGHYLSSYFIAASRFEIGGTTEESCSFENWGYTYGRCLPSPYLLSLYDQEKDRRYSEYYIHQYKNTSDKEISYGNATVMPGEYFPLYKNGNLNKNLLPGCIKYGDIWTRQYFETRSFKDVIVYRLAETYIIGAEAALMLGDQEKAKKYYNKTWMRAGNDEFTGTLSMKDIIDEQARELALEGDRWYFLKRLGILVEQVKNYAGHPELSASLAGRTNLPANPHFIRWPIPENEIINMGAENFPQNLGY